jgi:hypothetical protein
MSVPAKQISASTIEDVIAYGDLSKLTEQQRTDYYVNLCKSLGLNPLTQPFEYLTLNNKLVLYAKRACADQLRKINGISLQVVSQDEKDGLLTVHVRAEDQTGRKDEDLGAVNFPDTLRGEGRANAILKAVTKAKRRVTLSICGLGFLDETEVEDIPALAKTSVVASNIISGPPAIKSITVTSGGPGTKTDVKAELTTGEIINPKKLAKPHEIPVDNSKPDWIAFGQAIIAGVSSATPDDAYEWLGLNDKTIDRMQKDAPKVHKRMMDAVKKMKVGDDVHPRTGD